MQKGNAISIRLTDAVKIELETKAQQERISKTDLINRAINEYLYKDVNIQNELLATLEMINKNIKKNSEEFNVFYAYFIHMIKYFAVIYNDTMRKYKEPGDIEGKSDASILLKRTELEKGEKVRESFINTFKKENPKIIPLVESLFAEYITEENG